MTKVADQPLIIQSDRSILLEVDHPGYEAARDELVRFAELEKSPEHIHTYRVTPLSIWNACAASLSAGQIISSLERFSRYEVPENVVTEIKDWVSRYGRITLVREDGRLVLESDDRTLMEEIWRDRSVRKYLLTRLSDRRIEIDPRRRGHVKQALVKIGFPAEDLAGYAEGESLPMELLSECMSGGAFSLRDYQREASEVFYAGGAARGGSGVVVLPCGAGKTVVGMAAMALVKTHTLILVTSTIAVRQWRRELLDKTTLTRDIVGEYTGEVKEIKPVTVCTYQILVHTKKKGEKPPHFEVFYRREWGLIIYDEVHLLPAPVFRLTAEIQACRRLGLTATLVREDGREDDVFSLIGPKRYDVPWKVLEKQGWIAQAECIEIRVPLPEDVRTRYAIAGKRSKFRLASENTNKLEVLRRLISIHEGDSILIIGQYLDQLHRVAKETDAPIITGRTANSVREELYARFREGEISCLILSKVGNFAIDLPEANVAIQISGTFGSRQEEAQRLGRILRPKSDGRKARFYSLVSRDSRDQEFAANRHLFLTEQGYSYRIVDADDVLWSPSGIV